MKNKEFNLGFDPGQMKPPAPATIAAISAVMADRGDDLMGRKDLLGRVNAALRPGKPVTDRTLRAAISFMRLGGTPLLGYSGQGYTLTDCPITIRTYVADELRGRALDLVTQAKAMRRSAVQRWNLQVPLPPMPDMPGDDAVIDEETPMMAAVMSVLTRNPGKRYLGKELWGMVKDDLGITAKDNRPMRQAINEMRHAGHLIL